MTDSQGRTMVAAMQRWAGVLDRLAQHPHESEWDRLRPEDIAIRVYCAPDGDRFYRGVEVVHTPTGVMVREHASTRQHENRVFALLRLDVLVCGG